MTFSPEKTNTWYPLIGEIRERTDSVLNSIAKRYIHPGEVCLKSKSIPLLQADGFTIERWADESLSNGYPSVCLLLGQLDSLYPDTGWDRIGHVYLQKLQGRLEESSIYDLSLYGGLAGVLMGIRALSRGGTRYQSMLDQVASWFEELAMDQVPMYLQRLKSGQLKMSEYDTIVGLSGIGRLVLLFYERPRMKQIWEQIIEYFHLFCASKDWEGKQVPGWHIKSKDQFLAEDSKQYPKGNFNLSLSHGIAGPLALLSISMIQGISSARVEQEVRILANWLNRWQVKDHAGIMWPGRVSYEEWEQEKLHPENARYYRDSWCYGAPGMARALWLAGEAVQNEHWASLGLQAYLDMEKRIEQNGGMISATMCHGLAGWLHLVQRMYSDTGNPLLRGIRDRLVERLLNMFEPASMFGYCDRNMVDGTLRDTDEAGFLNGAAGVSLVLASLLSDNSPEWDQVLLIH